MRWYLRLVLFFSVCVALTYLYPPFTPLVTAGLGAAIWLVLRPLVDRFEALERVSAGPMERLSSPQHPPSEMRNP